MLRGVSLPARPRTTSPGVLDLGRHGTNLALHLPDGSTLDHAGLAERAAASAAEIGPDRRLAVVAVDDHLTSVVQVLAALEHGHVALLVPADRPDQLARAVDAYAPDVVGTPDGWEQRRPDSVHVLHPELALLLSTSGSTGSPKQVRLSRTGLRANAAAIATTLGLAEDDCAVTSLPLHYCYGLSVLTSHLLVGGALALTPASVLDPELWTLAERARVTTLPAVPHTIDLLERSGLADRDLPTLRRITQAGGRLEPARVRHHAALGRRRGWDLVVMYGQTEASARMACLPPGLAEEHPASIGVPVPGGSFHLEPVADHPDPEVGELVYRGPNVMLGYAHGPADLARGRDVEELRTGDLARCRDGLWEIVGRRDRVAKLLGLRLDLDDVESLLRSGGTGSEPGVPQEVRVVADERHLHLLTTARGRAADLRAQAGELTGLPPHAITVTRVPAMPLTPSGKPDRGALHVLARRAAPGAPARTLREEVALVLGRDPVDPVDPARSVVELGGDSLTYVELGVRLGRRLGDLPADWHRMPLGDLEALEALAAGSAPRPRGPIVDALRPVPLETSVALRAAAIVAIVGTHANLLTITGGAHALLAVLGFNLARLRIGDQPRGERVRGLVRAARRIAVPTVVVAGLVVLLSGQYRPTTALLLNQALGSDRWTDDWQLWFVEVAVWLTLGTAALLAVPPVDAWERRHPFALPLTLTVAGLGVRLAWTGVEAGPTERYTVGVVAWLAALGWTAARATNAGQKLTVAALATIGTVGLLGDLRRELVVVAAVCALVWIRRVRVPAALASLTATLAASSLWVYLTHWQVYPWLEVDHPLAATLASFAVGIAAWQAWRRLEGALSRRWGARSARAGSPGRPRAPRRGSSSRTAPPRRSARAGAGRR